MIDLEHVSKRYPTPHGVVEALRDVTLHVEAGEFVAVRGPSGCGKSTMLLLVGGLARPSSGKIVVDGRDLGKLSSAELAAFRAKTIGFVFQTFHLLPYLNVVQNVVVAAENEHRADAIKRAEAMLERFGLADRMTHRPAELSAGECQRVAIARALINKPKLLLADEPTGNLDRESAQAVLELLGDFNRQGGTVFLVTHDDYAAGFASRTVQLAKGELVDPATREPVST
ncbi:MAG: ABC transporter ATP-binding protein [Planctomycetota bacterium]|nr:MAG: ABC transporter ATP-binding protein [Planctomycetota bacterium]